MSFKRLDSGDFVFDASSIAAFAWDDYISSLTSFYTSSQQSLTYPQYYLDIYASNPNIPSTSSTTSDIQFSIAYGDSAGSGSFWYSPASPGLSPTRTVWGQFVNLLLGEDENASFNFGGGKNADAFFVITVNRANYKQSIMPGSLKIKGIINPGFTLLNPNSFITDNSLLVSAPDYTPAGRRYDLGASISEGRGIPYQGIKFGYIYIDIGIIILNPAAVRQVFSNNSNTNDNNPAKLVSYFTEFSLLSEETVSSNYIFCRAQNSEFNYSLNPTFETSSFISSYNEFLQVPATYITSVGLYNNNNELLAVAKLSKPLKKEFDTEALVRVKLDF
jgi:hypothetical protein